MSRELNREKELYMIRNNRQKLKQQCLSIQSKLIFSTKNTKKNSFQTNLIPSCFVFLVYLKRHYVVHDFLFLPVPFPFALLYLLKKSTFVEVLFFSLYIITLE